MQRHQNTCTSIAKMQNGEATIGNHSVAPQKINVEQPYDPAVSLAAIYTGNCK